jgi:ATP-dependent DNA helicase RecQ
LKIDLLEHAGLCSKDQKTIIQNFVKEESTIRLIICTVAFGLGVNIPDVRFVVHWGACDSALQYWQEVGRAGRDGNKAMYVCHQIFNHSYQ